MIFIENNHLLLHKLLDSNSSFLFNKIHEKKHVKIQTYKR